MNAIHHTICLTFLNWWFELKSFIILHVGLMHGKYPQQSSSEADNHLIILCFGLFFYVLAYFSPNRLKLIWILFFGRFVILQSLWSKIIQTVAIIILISMKIRLCLFYVMYSQYFLYVCTEIIMNRNCCVVFIHVSFNNINQCAVNNFHSNHWIENNYLY